MSTAAAFIPLIHGQLAELKKICGSLFHRPVRESIAATETYIQNLNSSSGKIDFKIALEPFFKAVKENNDLKFLPTVLDCFYNVFKQSTPDIYLNRQLTQAIITILVELLDSNNRGNSDEVNLRCCNVCIACLRSYSGIHFAHGKLLKKLFMLLFQIYNDSENPNTYNSISTSINESMTALFDSYLTPPEVPTGSKTIEELAQNVTNGLFQNADSIMHYLEPILKEGDYTASVRDVDVYVVLSLLSKIIEQNKLKLQTISLASSILVSVLQKNSDFYKTSAFKLLINTKIHVAAISLILDPRPELAKVTSEMIITLWEKFAPIYFENLNELLVKGLGQALNSPESGILSRALTIFNALTKKPQIFVDAYVNYDCDDSGNFKNTFEDTINRVVGISFPDMVQTSIQRKALEVLVNLLGSLWFYFDNFKPSDDIKEEPEKPQDFLDAKKTKNVFNHGLSIFKNSWKKGIKFFIDNKFCEDTPESIAKFLFNTPALSPAQIGEIIGNVDRTDVLKEFVKLFDFKSVSFENAFRAFLSKFQIPGEAQMIDRIMEQFGTKYYNDNPSVFSCADTVYVLAFSTLMLHTDAHHPNVTSRMTLQEFINNNRGIDNGKDLPPEFLEDLYKGITKKKIFVQASGNDEVLNTNNNSSLLTRRQRADMFRAQCKHTLMAARERIVSTQQTKIFHKSESPLFIGPMFRSIWGGALGTLTMTFEQTNVEEVYSYCLDGLTYSVHIASHCFVDEALDTLVDSFAKFTALRKNLSEVQPKNLKCTNALLNLALIDGNFLRNAWPIVLGEISAIEKIKETNRAFQTPPQLEDIFTVASEKLDRESILDFVQAMCDISKQELNEKPARISMCQKLSVVAHFNLKREHFIWTKVWDIIGNFLKYVGSTYYLEIAKIAVNVLMQLASKFLDQKELIEYHFQEHFMSPFYDIFEAQSDISIKLFVLENIYQLIERKGQTIQSGWTTIFEILTHATEFPETQSSCFTIVTFLIDQYLSILSIHYIHIMSIILYFVRLAPEELKIASIPLYQKVAEFLVLNDEMTKEQIDQWNTLFQALKDCSIEPLPKVRDSAHEVFLEIMKKAIRNKPSIQSNITTELLTIYLPISIKGAKAESQKFYEQSSEFLDRFYRDVIIVNWPEYFLPNASTFYEHIIKLFEMCCISQSTLLCKVAIDVYLAFILQVFETLNNDYRNQLSESFMSISLIIFKSFSLDNSVKFIKAIEKIVTLAVKNDDKVIANKFIDILFSIDSKCQSMESQVLVHQIWSLDRSNLLKCLCLFGNEELERINKCINISTSMFVDFDTSKKLDDESFVSWNKNMLVTLQQLNKMDDSMFETCFKTSSSNIVEMVTTKSLDIRKQINITLKRELIKKSNC